MAPLYNFVCPVGHLTEALCKVDLSDAPKTCPEPRVGAPRCTCGVVELCGGKLTQTMTAPASTFPGADRWRGGL